MSIPASPRSLTESPWAKYLWSVLLSVGLSFLAARFGIQPAPLPPPLSPPPVVNVYYPVAGSLPCSLPSSPGSAKP
jgi:hypothetical protein